MIVRAWAAIAALLVCAASCLGADYARAQAEPPGAESQDEISLSVVSIGVGNKARAGDWAGILIRFTDLGTTQREVVFEVQTRDVDGDSPQYRRTVTTNPGSDSEQVWVYAYLQMADQDRPLTVSAYEALPSSAAAAEITGVRFDAGKLLGRITTAGSPLRRPDLGTMLVVGRQPGGLSGYAEREISSDAWMARGHELTEAAADLTPAGLPDRSVGLVGIETIVWTSADPTRLSPTRSEALRQWVERGGHLVVSLPATPQIWFDQVRNDLAGVLPMVDAERADNAAQSLRPLLTYETTAVVPDSLVVHDLVALGTAEPDEAWPVLRDADGRTVVARRRVGLGQVTLIGFDVSNRALSARGLPGMRAFWHRVLGRTGLPRDTDTSTRPTIAQREVRYFDDDIASLIAKSQAVVLGVLAGFGVFGVYWLLAAPLSYFALRHFGRKQHSWLVFTAMIAVFTGVTWGGVSYLRPRTAEVQAIVFLDGVEGSELASARMFASVLVPKYGQGGLRAGDSADTGFAAIAPWSESTAGLGAVTSTTFPDVRGYALSGRNPDRMVFPARSTVKTVRADWAGERRWSMFRAVTPSGQVGELRLNADGTITGSLAHGLPGALEDAMFIVVPPQARLARRVGQADITNARVRSLRSGDRWEPGQIVDIGALMAPQVDPSGNPVRRNEAEFFEDLAGKGAATLSTNLAGATSSGRVRDRLLAAALMSRMPPPRTDARGVQPIGLRRYTHGLDLGSWFSQPCVIVLGVVQLDESMDLPVPLSIESGGEWRALRGDGIAVVRWVYPLRASPPDATSADTEDRPS